MAEEAKLNGVEAVDEYFLPARRKIARVVGRGWEVFDDLLEGSEG